jgi:hypothetical protein
MDNQGVNSWNEPLSSNVNTLAGRQLAFGLGAASDLHHRLMGLLLHLAGCSILGFVVGAWVHYMTTK